jgi:hypothetical protein
MSSKPEPSRGELPQNYNTDIMMDLVTADLYQDDKENSQSSNYKKGIKDIFHNSSEFKVSKFLIGKQHLFY